jgi:hypothetical protein
MLLLMYHEHPVCLLVSLPKPTYFAIDPHTEMLYFGLVAMTDAVQSTASGSGRYRGPFAVSHGDLVCASTGIIVRGVEGPQR